MQAKRLPGVDLKLKILFTKASQSVIMTDYDVLCAVDIYVSGDSSLGWSS